MKKPRKSIPLTDDMYPPDPISPGEFIALEIKARGWTQADLAEIMQRPLQTVNQIIRGKKAITSETAVGLGAALGTSAQLWMNLETQYRLHPKMRKTLNEKAIRARARARDRAVGKKAAAAGRHRHL